MPGSFAIISSQVRVLCVRESTQERSRVNVHAHENVNAQKCKGAMGGERFSVCVCGCGCGWKRWQLI